MLVDLAEPRTGGAVGAGGPFENVSTCGWLQYPGTCNTFAWKHVGHMYRWRKVNVVAYCAVVRRSMHSTESLQRWRAQAASAGATCGHRTKGTLAATRQHSRNSPPSLVPIPHSLSSAPFLLLPASTGPSISLSTTCLAFFSISATHPSMPSAALSLLLALLVLLALAHSATAAGNRILPDSVKNKEFFKTVRIVRQVGAERVSDCGPNQFDIEECITTCNSPGNTIRNGCCCAPENGRYYVGLRGSCRYEQVLFNYTGSERVVYVSRPVNTTLSPGLYFDRRSCQSSDTPKDEFADRSCTCEMSWTATYGQVANTSPVPTITPTPSPTSTPTSVSPTPSPTSTPIPTPSASQSVEPAPASPSPEASVTSSPFASPAVKSPSPPATTPTSSPTPSSSTSLSQDAPDPSFSPEDSPEDDGGVCVDAGYLDALGVAADERVHRQAIKARVLCPRIEGLPCGTAHHVVRFRGRTASYAELCAGGDVQCGEDRMLVNSVWTHAWVERAHGDAVLTMYDVRHGERAQRMLHRVMRVMRMVRL